MWEIQGSFVRMEAPMDPTATGHLERRHPTTADGSKNQSNWIKVNNFITKYTSYWLFFFITQEWSSGTKWPSLPADTCTSYNSKPPVKAVKTRIANCCHKSHSHYRRCVLNVQRTTRYLKCHSLVLIKRFISTCRLIINDRIVLVIVTDLYQSQFICDAI